MSRTQVADVTPVGTKIRVKEGIASPEFPDFSYSGWVGSVVELTGKKSARKYVIEWDDQIPPYEVLAAEALRDRTREGFVLLVLDWGVDQGVDDDISRHGDHALRRGFSSSTRRTRAGPTGTSAANRPPRGAKL